MIQDSYCFRAYYVVLTTLTASPPQPQLPIYKFFPFLLVASEFRKGKLLVRLSAPVLLLMRPLSPPNITHHSPNAASRTDPSAPKKYPPAPV